MFPVPLAPSSVEHPPSDNHCSFDDPSDSTNPFMSSPPEPRRRRGSVPKLFIQPMTILEDRPHSAVEADIQDMLPLVGKGPGKLKTKGKTRRTFDVIFANLSRRKRKADKGTGPSTEEMDVSEDLAAAQDPFGDENAMECETEVGWQNWRGFGNAEAEAEPEAAVEDIEMALGSPRGAVGASGGGTSPRAVFFPRTPQRKRRASLPMTPRSSPRSARSRSTPRGTPCSAKSWLTTSSERSTVSTLNSLSRHRRRRARDKLASQAKSIQLLGVEAVGAVARATKVSENRLKRKTLALK